MNTPTAYTLTREDAQEVAHKLGVLADSPELAESYGLTEAQAEALRASVPHTGGQWVPPGGEAEAKAIAGEMADHCEILSDQARDARNARQPGAARFPHFPQHGRQNDTIGAALNRYERRECTARDVRRELAALA